MARLVRAIHAFLPSRAAKTWMTRIKRVMTKREAGDGVGRLHGAHTKTVMARLVRAIHAFRPSRAARAWMARIKRAMT